MSDTELKAARGPAMHFPTVIGAAIGMRISPDPEIEDVARRARERVADLATNIGEDAVYLAEGKTIKHHLEDGGTGQPEAGRGPTVAGAED